MVALVGAGPGDVGLLTKNGYDEIEKAEVVVYDRLVSSSILELIPPSAEKINVGKSLSNHLVPQNEINEILLQKSLEGKYVVRLKGGDSFLFGRGGEELELLQQNDIPFKVIPGITSAFAAATYAGIPITHRDFCSSVHIITGHKRENGVFTLDYDALIKLNGTLVFMMSVSKMNEIASGLMKSGMPASMPCVIIENGTRANQRKVLTTIENIGDEIINHAIISPAVIIVGKVCTMSNSFDWFSNLPLKGKKILVTKPKSTAHKLVSSLRDLGADVTAISSIKTENIHFDMPLLDKYSAIVFTSATGVKSFFDKLHSLNKDARALSNIKCAVIGSKTAEELFKYGIKADFMPSIYDGETLAREMITTQFIKGALLLLRGNIATKEINDILSKNQIAFDEITVYNIIYEKNKSIDLDDYDMITFTSASCVKGICFENTPHEITAICIGSQTATEAKKLGFKITIAEKPTIESMVEAIKEMCDDQTT